MLASLPGFGMLSGKGQAWGSNGWVVAGSRTASGKPLLANDTHLGLQMPSVWYQVGLHGGGYDEAGFSFPGMPFVVIGHNPRIAWGITNLCADVEDLYIEKLDDPVHPRRYQFQDAWRDLVLRREQIEVKGQARDHPRGARDPPRPDHQRRHLRAEGEPAHRHPLAGPRRHPPGRLARGA